MNQDAVGAASMIVFSIAIGLLHLFAARDPERNGLTRLMRDYYEHDWPLLGSLPSRQAMWLVGIGGFVVALAETGLLIYALTR